MMVILYSMQAASGNGFMGLFVSVEVMHYMLQLGNAA